jgi:DNA polymerase-3 subunit alpha
MQMAPEFIARRHGRAETEYLHPMMEPILGETWGVPLYQEQVMKIANVLAGFSMAESDGLRKAMGKKMPAVMAEYRDRFIDGCKGNGIEKPLAVEIFDMIERFSGYGFVKSHSAAYGVITAQTAYLKANYPVQFMAALMSTEIGNTEKTVFNVAECRRAGIPLLPPNVNQSGAEYTVEQFEGREAIRFGLAAVKNVGMGAVESVIASRQEQPDGQFSSLEAFCDGVSWSDLNKRAMECLVKSGALDCFGERGAILESIEPLMAAAQQRQKAASRGQMDLFGAAFGGAAPVSMPAQLVRAQPVDSKDVLAWEKETLGLYLSAHPLTDITGKGVPDGYLQVGDVADRAPGSKANLIGMIVSIRRIATRNNRTMAVLELEDLTGTIEVVAFPDTWEQMSSSLVEDAVLAFTCKVDERGDARQLILESATGDLPVVRAAEPEQPPVEIAIDGDGDYWQVIGRMQDVDRVLERHDGSHPVDILLRVGGATHRLRSRKHLVEWSTSLERELNAIVGVSRAILVGGGEAGKVPHLRLLPRVA